MKASRVSKGFTLIELLIVITIIGILAAALLPNILSAPARARDATRQADMNNIINAIEVYNADTGAYPLNTAATGECITAIPDISTFSAYFPSGVPTDPTATASVGPCTGGYFYCRLDGSPENYLVAAYAETATENADETTLDGLAICDTGSGGGAAPSGLFDTTTNAGAIAIVK